MFLIRTVFYLIIAYFVSKLIRIFIEPSRMPTAQKSGTTTTHTNSTSNTKTEKREPLGDYIEFEEVKS
jgi:hypothetical protein